jgi:hypothetical protein
VQKDTAATAMIPRIADPAINISFVLYFKSAMRSISTPPVLHDGRTPPVHASYIGEQSQTL